METTSGSIPGNGSAATSGNGAGALNKASAALHSVIDDAARKAKPAIDKYATLAHDATDKLSTAGSQTADWMSAKGESLSATQKQLVEDTSKYVSANPMKSLAIAVAAGFVLSRILK